jgi:uncharacterized protein (DUF305 family)
VRRRLWFSGLLAALVLVAAACGGDSGPTGDGAATPTTASESSRSLNDADVVFAQGMIPHHEQAVAMAELALDPAVGASEEVRALAARIKDAQDPEIELMTGWLQGGGHPLTMDTSGGHSMESMDGMMSVEEMDMLEGARGREFDERWAEMMIRHHEGAIAMAETVKAEGSDRGVAELADAIISAQQAEIDQMRRFAGQ